MRTSLLAWLLGCGVLGIAKPITISTSSGRLQGIEENGVMSFKKIRYGQPATGALRWEPPVPFVSSDLQNATALGPACVQQFAFTTAPLFERIFNNPSAPPPESEDCLFLNVWAPSSPSAVGRPVVIWMFPGGLAWGTASLPEYDGTSVAANQDIVIVTINYRTNVFGFPSSPDLNLQKNNLGFMDQELTFQWVQNNIQQFGGDPNKVTIMGHSAGSLSVSAAISRHSQGAPFRAGIMLSAEYTSMSPAPSFTSFDAFAVAVGCNQAPGATRLQCLKRVPAAIIRNYTNGPTSGAFNPVVDNITLFADPLERVRTKQGAQVPILIGNTQDDGTLFTVGQTNLSALLTSGAIPQPSVTSVPADVVTPLYPGLNASQITARVFRDTVVLCPAQLWSGAVLQSGITSVFRYIYGAVFADNQPFPGAGAWHSSELPEFFGTFNRTTATAAEATLSHSFQTAFANFIKDPNTNPAPNWQKYVPGNATQTLAKLAYVGNVETDNFVQAVQSDIFDGPCNALWDQVLDFTR